MFVKYELWKKYFLKVFQLFIKLIFLFKKLSITSKINMKIIFIIKRTIHRFTLWFLAKNDRYPLTISETPAKRMPTFSLAVYFWFFLI